MEEQFDVINEQDEVIGQAARSAVHAQGLWHRGVHVFLFTADGRMLIQQRSADRKQYPSQWDCSVSEHVKAGEDYVNAAQRGLWEELGLRDVTLTPRLRFRLNYGPNDNEISLLFTGTVYPARVHFDPVEIAQVDYLSITELLDWAGRDESDLCYWFIQLLRWYAGGEKAVSRKGDPAGFNGVEDISQLVEFSSQ
ncbi:MAG: NUDIX domain-containing protein [Chloroflexota bacterium]